MTVRKDSIQMNLANKIYVGSFSLNTLMVLEASEDKVIKNYDVSAGTRDVFSDSNGNIYAISDLAGTITIIRTNGEKEVLNIENDGYAAVDNIIDRVYVTKNGRLNIYDLISGKMVADTDGLNSPSRIKLDIQDNKLYIVDVNSIKVFNTATLEYENEISVPQDINSIFSDDCKKMYISYGNTQLTCGIEIYDLLEKNVVSTIRGNELINPGAMAVDNNILYVVNNISRGNIRIIDVATSKILPDIINVGANPSCILPVFQKKKLYGANSGSGTVSIVNIADRKVKSVLIGAASQPCCIAAFTFDAANIKMLGNNSNFLKGDKEEYMYIIAKKIFSSYQQRMCFPIVNIPIPQESENINFEKIVFENGNIVQDSLIITPIEDREDYSRVQMSIDIPYRAVLSTEQGNVLNITGSLPAIYKDIVVMIPHSRDEYKYEIVVDTKSEQLNSASIMEEQLRVSVGVFIVIKIVGDVEVKIEEAGYAAEPPECEEFEESQEEDVCKAFLDFSQTPFPQDFFPVNEIK